MKYCTSICFDSVEEMLNKINECSDQSDFLEIRLDKISIENNYNDLPYEKFIRASKGKKLVLTNRNKKDGGFFEGNDKQRLSILADAAEYKFDLADIELNTNKKQLIEFIRNKRKKKIILSYHNFKNTPDNLEKIYLMMKEFNPDVIKICTYAKDINDNLKIFDLQRKIPTEQKRVIHAMGEKGEISRIIGGLKYNYFTFTAPGENLESAPGQLTIQKFKDIYKVERIGKDFKIFGLAGNPVRQSKGIIIHNHALNELKIKGIYLNFLIDDFGKFINGYFDLIDGLSITIPFKEKALQYVDFPDEKAGRIGAVNTIIKKNNRLYGYNTDYFGIKKSLEGFNTENKTIVLLGAGGGARSALAVLKENQNNIIIINRTIDKAKKLSNEFNCEFGGYEDLSKIKFDLLINSTPVGMNTNPDNSPVDKKYLKNCTVFDMVYNPVKTKLLIEAENNGCKVISGLKMFLYQAEEQFRLFTGKKYPFYSNKKKIMSII
jgi:3-dehydroquinate dehydratase / shikimate dehydrogenase